MRSSLSSIAGLLIMFSSFSANAESISGKVQSKLNARSYNIQVDGQLYRTIFSEPIDLKLGRTVFFEGTRENDIIKVSDSKTVGIMQN